MKKYLLYCVVFAVSALCCMAYETTGKEYINNELIAQIEAFDEAETICHELATDNATVELTTAEVETLTAKIKNATTVLKMPDDTDSDDNPIDEYVIISQLEIVKDYTLILPFIENKSYESKTFTTTLEGLYDALGISAEDLNAKAEGRTFAQPVLSIYDADTDETTYELSDTLVNPLDATDGWFGRYSNYDEASGNDIPFEINALRGWGTGCTFYIHEITLEDSEFSVVAGQFPGTLKVGDTDYAYLYIVNGTKAARIKLQIEINPYPVIDPNNMVQVGETTVQVTATINDSYATKRFSIDMEAICIALGCSIDDIEDIYTMNNGKISDEHNFDGGGYFYDEKGVITNWGNGAAFFIETNIISEGKFSVGQMSGHFTDITEPVTCHAQLVFLYSTNYYIVNVEYTVILPESLDHSTWVQEYAAVYEVQLISSEGYEQDESSKTYLDLAAIAAAIGTDDPILYGESWDGDKMTYSDAYSATPNPGFWMASDGISVGSWGTGSAYGMIYDNGVIAYYAMPDDQPTGATYESRFYLVNEGNGQFAKITLHIEYVDKRGGTSSNVMVNATNFPDDNFRSYLLKQPYGEDGYITDEEIESITSMDISNCNISSLQGIEYFTALNTLYCNNNKLATLNLSKNSALTVFLCYDNMLSALDMSQNTKLKHLDCSGNKLTELDITHNPALTWLYCNDNKLTSLDVSQNSELRYFYCNDNNLTALDVSMNTAVTEIYCYNNQLYGESMDAFINSLPANTTDEVHILRILTDESEEGNVCTKAQVTAIKAKGWIPYCKSNGEWTEYDGSIVVEINETNFPDENFRNYLLEQDYGKDGIITETEIASITRIIVSDRNISSLQGIEFFTALSFLRCFGNQLTSLDVSKNLVLTDLDCRSNMIASLDVSKNTALQVLWCGDNPITTLDVSCNTALTELHCSYTQITILNVLNNINLTKLWCHHTQLITLDISKNVNLTLLDCGGNQLATLDVSKNTKLTSLDCISNQLTTLDVSKNTKLTEISCYRNQLQGKSMDAFINSLPTNTTDTLYKLQLMHSYNENNICTKKQVASIKAKGWTPFYSGGMVEYEGSEEIIDINETNFPDDKFRSYLLAQSYGSDGKITETEIENITSINVSNKNISSLQGIEYFTALMQLLCGNNKLTTLDVSQNMELTHLGCDSNQLTALNVSENTKLIWLYCHSNKLTALDVSNNTELRYLHCYDNQLTALDVSRNTELKSLECYNNNISGYAMDTFISSLPMNMGSELQPLRLLTDDMDEGNSCTMEQAQAFKAKGWTPMVRIDGVWVEYEEATAIRQLNAEDVDDENAEYYTLDGVRIEKPTKKGIYIRNGKKVVIK